MGLDVVCPSCKGVYHETTKEFAEKKPIHGAMFRAKPICKKLNLWTFPELSHVKTGDIECPNCGTNYEVNGRITVINRAGTVKNTAARSIPEDLNDIIWAMYKNKKRITTIAKKVGFSQQAVSRRLYDLKRRHDYGLEPSSEGEG